MEGSRITPYRNGPYLIRGEFTLVDQDGVELPVRRKTIALCRCGASRTKPFCDGTHKLIGFRAQSGAGGETPANGARSVAGQDANGTRGSTRPDA